MIDIKKIHPGLAFLNNLSSISSNGIVNMASERTDLLPHDKLIRAAQKAIADGFNQYTDINGYLPLREKVAELFRNEYTATFNPKDEVTITAGSSQAISSAISAFIREGDEVILFEPCFYFYDIMVMANGGRPVYIQLKGTDFHVDWDEVQKVINARTKMVIINSPHYPTGTVFSASDMERLTKIINGTKIIVLSDESFNKVIYDGLEHQSVARFPKLAEHSLIFSSFGKALHVEGWKLGYCVAPASFSAAFRKVHYVQTFSVNTPLQVAVAEVVSDPEVLSSVKDTFEAKRNRLVKGLKNSKFRFVPAKGTYFQILNYGHVSDEKEVDFCQKLIKDHQLAVMPLSYFYHEGTDNKYIRLCFAKNDQVIDQTIEILKSI